MGFALIEGSGKTMSDDHISRKSRRMVSKAGKKLALADFEESWLPWRRERTPYRIFLAEFLLVRTRTDVVAKLYEDIYQVYPSLDAIAVASDEDLARVLNPLGLQKRVPYLKRAAEYLLRNHNGEIPCRVDSLMKVPGLGAYTATAIAAFVCDLPTVPADVNILRFISRLTGLEMEHTTKGSKEICALLPYLSKRKSGLRPENLLDFTRLICRPRNPRCSECPLNDMCVYLQTRIQE
jgi:A/G-specific adenine glycosylase